MVLGIVEYGIAGEMIVLALGGMVVLPPVGGEVVWMIRRSGIEIGLIEENVRGIETASIGGREIQAGGTVIGRGRGKERERETEIGNGNARETVTGSPEIGVENTAGGSPAVWTCLRCQ